MRERERETKATWRLVSRLVLNSKNVGNSKHFSQSKRKPQSPGCLCALWQQGCDPPSDGRKVGRLTPQSYGKPGCSGNTNKHSLPRVPSELLDENSGHHGPGVDKKCRASLFLTGMQLTYRILYAYTVYIHTHIYIFRGVTVYFKWIHIIICGC